MLRTLTQRALRQRLLSPPGRFNSTASGQPQPAPKSRHASFYSDTVPAMIPIFLLGSAVYLGLRLTQMQLSHEKFKEDATARIQSLEAEIMELEKQPIRPAEAVQGGVQPEASTEVIQKRSKWRLGF